MIWKISILTAAAGSLATLYYIRAMTEHIGPPVAAAVLVSFLVGPYSALALLTWCMRSHLGKSIVLFAFTLTLACFGVFVYSVQYDHFLDRDPTTPGGFDPIPFMLAVVQWFVTFCLSAILWLSFLYQKCNSRSA
jgi:hypothetical protein